MAVLVAVGDGDIDVDGLPDGVEVFSATGGET
mgnify:CR=1 FL=1